MTDDDWVGWALRSHNLIPRYGESFLFHMFNQARDERMLRVALNQTKDKPSDYYDNGTNLRRIVK